MRILSGKYKSRLIKMPLGIRPTQDKVRKAVFDILGDIGGESFLDLFAGSGAVGLEAASQGATKVVLVEYNYDCVKVINSNIRLLGAYACQAYQQEAGRAIQEFGARKERFEVIFLDPPYLAESDYPKRHIQGIPFRYRKDSYLSDNEIGKKTLQILGGCDILAPDGLVIAQHFKKQQLEANFGNLEVFKISRYGDTVLSLYRRA